MASVGFNPSIQLPKNLTVKRERNHWICCSTGTTIYIDDHRTMIDPNARIVPEAPTENNESLIARCCSCFSKICCKTGKKNALVFDVLQKAFTAEFGSEIAESILQEVKGPLTLADFTQLQEAAKLLRMFKEAQKNIPSPPPPSRAPSPFTDSADIKIEVQKLSSENLEEKQCEIKPLEIGSISFSRSSSLNLSDQSPINVSAPPPSIEVFRKTYQDRVFVSEGYNRQKLEKRLQDLLLVEETKIPEIAAKIERRLPRTGSIGSEVIRQQVIDTIQEEKLPLKNIPSSSILKKGASLPQPTQSTVTERYTRGLFNRSISIKNPEKTEPRPPGGIFMNQVKLNTQTSVAARKAPSNSSYSNLPSID